MTLQNSRCCVASVCVHIFSKFQRQWKPCVFSSTGAPPSAPQEVSSQPPASLVLLRLLSRPLREMAANALHPDHTRKESRDPWPHGSGWGKTGPWPSVWVLTWTRTQSHGESSRVEQGGHCRDPHPLWRNARRKQPQQNFLCSLGKEGGARGPLSIVRQTQHRHFYLSSPQQIRTGNTVLYSPINKAAVGWLHLHRAAYCSGMYYLVCLSSVEIWPMRGFEGKYWYCWRRLVIADTDNNDWNEFSFHFNHKGLINYSYTCQESVTQATIITAHLYNEFVTVGL